MVIKAALLVCVLVLGAVISQPARGIDPLAGSPTDFFDFGKSFFKKSPPVIISLAVFHSSSRKMALNGQASRLYDCLRDFRRDIGTNQFITNCQSVRKSINVGLFDEYTRYELTPKFFGRVKALEEDLLRKVTERLGKFKKEGSYSEANQGVLNSVTSGNLGSHAYQANQTLVLAFPSLGDVLGDGPFLDHLTKSADYCIDTATTAAILAKQEFDPKGPKWSEYCEEVKTQHKRDWVPPSVPPNPNLPVSIVGAARDGCSTSPGGAECAYVIAAKCDCDIGAYPDDNPSAPAILKQGFGFCQSSHYTGDMPSDLGAFNAYLKDGAGKSLFEGTLPTWIAGEKQRAPGYAGVVSAIRKAATRCGNTYSSDAVTSYAQWAGTDERKASSQFAASATYGTGTSVSLSNIGSGNHYAGRCELTSVALQPVPRSEVETAFRTSGYGAGCFSRAVRESVGLNPNTGVSHYYRIPGTPPPMAAATIEKDVTTHLASPSQPSL